MTRRKSFQHSNLSLEHDFDSAPKRIGNFEMGRFGLSNN